MEYLSNGIAFFKPSRFGRLVRVFRGEANPRRIRDFRLSTLRYALGSSLINPDPPFGNMKVRFSSHVSRACCRSRILSTKTKRGCHNPCSEGVKEHWIRERKSSKSYLPFFTIYSSGKNKIARCAPPIHLIFAMKHTIVNSVLAVVKS
jgi:hypothetical protein